MTERWRPVVGYEGLYEVSSHGRVRNSKGQILSCRPKKNGYPTIGLYRGRPNRQTITVHRLVVTAFDRPPAEGEEVRHLDGNKLNNTIENLAWGSRSENVRDTIRHGNHNNVQKTHCPDGHPLPPPRRTSGGTWIRGCVKCRHRQITCHICGRSVSFRFRGRHEATKVCRSAIGKAGPLPQAAGS